MREERAKVDMLKNESTISYKYMTPAQKDIIESCCAHLRRTKNSRQNLFYMVANFGECIQKSVFEAEKLDATDYISFLNSEMNSGNLQEKYCACLYSELRTFFDYVQRTGLIEDNPFLYIDNPFEFPERMNFKNLPSLTEVDMLLSLCENDPILMASVLLSFKMMLPIGEVITLKKKQFGLDPDKGEVYLKQWRWIDGKKEEAYLLVPRDVLPFIQKLAAQTPSDYPYLLRNTKKKPFSARGLQVKLENIQKNTEIKINFSELRSLGIYLLLASQVPVKEISHFTNVRTDWLSRFDKIPEDYRLDTTKYMHIKIQ